MHAHIHTYIYIYIHTHIHTYIHAHIRRVIGMYTARVTWDCFLKDFVTTCEYVRACALEWFVGVFVPLRLVSQRCCQTTHVLILAF